MSATRPEGIPTEEPAEEAPRRKSQSFLWMSTTILGIIISVSVVLGFTGRTLFVTRDEYNASAIQYAQDKTVFLQTLAKIDNLMARQERAFDELSKTVIDLRLQAASRGK